jgi:curved DNA-binding protein
MTNFYDTLGVSKDASQDDIKKAYRSLANKHHPDKGGNQDTFKDISVAYDTLSDPTKRSEYDHQDHYRGHHEFNHNGFGHFNMHDIFGDIFSNSMRRNKDLNIRCQISFLDSFTGKQLDANFTMPSGKQQTVSIQIPAGIESGATIRYNGLGDDSLPGIPRGNLNVTIVVTPDPLFERRGDDIYSIIEITPIEAMIGCTKQVQKLTGEQLSLHIRPGVETGTEYANNNGGFTNMHTHRSGRYVNIIKIKSVPVTDEYIVEELRKIKALLDMQ